MHFWYSPSSIMQALQSFYHPLVITTLKLNFMQNSKLVCAKKFTMKPDDCSVVFKAAVMVLPRDPTHRPYRDLSSGWFRLLIVGRWKASTTVSRVDDLFLGLILGNNSDPDTEALNLRDIVWGVPSSFKKGSWFSKAKHKKDTEEKMLIN